MKKLVIALMILSFSTVCSAAWYVVSEENKVMSKSKYRPSQKDLDTRGEIAVFVEADVDLKEAEYRGGKVVKHKKTTAEAKETEDMITKYEEVQIIRQRALQDACEILELEGVIFKQIKCSDFDN